MALQNYYRTKDQLDLEIIKCDITFFDSIVSEESLFLKNTDIELQNNNETRVGKTKYLFNLNDNINIIPLFLFN